MDHHYGAPIVLTAPLTEASTAGFFIQMSLASIGWMEWVIDRSIRRGARCRRPRGLAGGAGLGAPSVLAREFGGDQVVVCYPDQLPAFIGERAWSRCPLTIRSAPPSRRGCTSIFESSREPVNAVCPAVFDSIRTPAAAPLRGHPGRIRRMADQGNGSEEIRHHLVGSRRKRRGR